MVGPRRGQGVLVVDVEVSTSARPLEKASTNVRANFGAGARLKNQPRGGQGAPPHPSKAGTCCGQGPASYGAKGAAGEPGCGAAALDGPQRKRRAQAAPATHPRIWPRVTVGRISSSSRQQALQSRRAMSRARGLGALGWLDGTGRNFRLCALIGRTAYAHAMQAPASDSHRPRGPLLWLNATTPPLHLQVAQCPTPRVRIRGDFKPRVRRCVDGFGEPSRGAWPENRVETRDSYAGPTWG